RHRAGERCGPRPNIGTRWPAPLQPFCAPRRRECDAGETLFFLVASHATAAGHGLVRSCHLIGGVKTVDANSWAASMVLRYPNMTVLRSSPMRANPQSFLWLR